MCVQNNCNFCILRYKCKWYKNTLKKGERELYNRERRLKKDERKG